MDANELVAMASKPKNTKDICFREGSLTVKGLTAHRLGVAFKMLMRHGIITIAEPEKGKGGDAEGDEPENEIQMDMDTEKVLALMALPLDSPKCVNTNPLAYIARFAFEQPVLDDQQAVDFCAGLDVDEIMEIFESVIECTSLSQDEAGPEAGKPSSDSPPLL